MAWRPCGASRALARPRAGPTRPPAPRQTRPRLPPWEPRELPASFPRTFRHFCFCREREEEGGQREGGAPGEAGGEGGGRSGFGRLLPPRHPQDVAFQVRGPLSFGLPGFPPGPVRVSSSAPSPRGRRGAARSEAVARAVPVSQGPDVLRPCTRVWGSKQLVSLCLGSSPTVHGHRARPVERPVGARPAP